MDAIYTSRLTLVSLSLDFIRAAEAHDSAQANAILGADYPLYLLAHTGLYARRRKQLEADPLVQPWLVRAIFLKDTSTVVGRIGFHEPPRDGAVELGYEICPDYRRRGFAEEAIRAMMAWAKTHPEVRRFVLSISPTNEPSLALAHKLGFTKIGEQMDEIDGPEDVFELPADAVGTV